MSRKLQVSDKLVTKYSRDGLTEQNLADGTERLISEKEADFELRPSGSSEEHIRYPETQIKGRKQKPDKSKADGTATSNFNITTEEKAAPYNVLADTHKITDFDATGIPSEPIALKMDFTNPRAKRKIPYQNTPDKDIDIETKDNRDTKSTNDKYVRYNYQDKPKKEYTRQEPKPNNFKKRQHKAVVNEHMKKIGALHTEQGSLKFTENKGHLSFNESSQKLHTDKIIDGALKFEATDDEAALEDDTVKATQTAVFHTASVAAQNTRGTLKKKRQRLSFEKSQQINSDDIHEVMDTLQGEQYTADSSGAIGSAQELNEKSRSYLRAEKKADKAMDKLNKAEHKQPTRKVIKAERVYDDKKGRARTKLHFEDEKKPPSNPHFIIEAPKQLIGAGVSAVAGKGHQKLYQAEHENSAVKAAHRTELLAENGAKKTVRYAVNRYRTKPYRLQKKTDRLKYKADKANRRLLFEQAKHENPELQKKLNKKTQQKKLIKKKYQTEMRKQAQKKTAKKAAEKTSRVLKALVTVKNKGCAVVALIAAILVIVICCLSASVITSMIGGFAGEYVSSNEEVENVVSAWNSMEDDIQSRIDNAEHDYPGYDRYVYMVETARADKQKLLAYLSTKHHSIVYDDCRTEVQDLFNQVYELSYEEYIDGDYRELDIKLHVNSLDDIIDRNLTTDEERQAYGAYLEIFQNSEDYNNIIHG
ncbi:MAG: CD1108 family mobile element protein [Candidatus Ornithomonoglobus sp.]